MSSINDISAMYQMSNVLEITEKEFNTIASYIEKNVGIKMPASKKVMMQSRLVSRIRKLGLQSYKEYIDYVFSDEEELILMIDALTTNKTEFFRESAHFDYMTETILPEFCKKGMTSVKIWSAGCSSGEEPYTLGIVMKEFIKNNPQTIYNFSITGSDISTKVLDVAYAGVYPLQNVATLPLDIKRKYFLKNSKASPPIVKIKNDVRSCVSFRRLNFMDSDFCMPEVYDIIFCRNVLIYFDKQTQENVIRKFMKYLVPGGYLFLGHSETILSMDLPLQTCAPTVYKKI